MATVSINEMEKKPGFITPLRVGLAIFFLVGLYATIQRYIQGLGAVTNLTDKFPWGFWVGFDVSCGAALAAGGFTITGLVYLANYKPYKPIVRIAVSAALLGYLMLATGLLYDVGRPWYMWHPLIMWNPHSVMFEVAWCVMLYIFVLTAEFSPMVFEKLGWKAPLKFIKSLVIVLVVVGVLLSTLHQSSLGTLYVIMKGRLYPLWYTPMLPVLFYTSAIMIAFAMVIFVSSLSTKIFRRSLEPGVIYELARFLLVGLIVYLGIRIQDLAVRGVGHMIWLPNIETFFFWIENGLLIAAMLMLFSRRIRRSRRWTLIAATLAIIGVTMHRFNVAIIGHYEFTQEFYYPSFYEIVISIFLAGMAIIAFALICKTLPVFIEAPAGGGAPGAGPGTGGTQMSGHHHGAEAHMDLKRWIPWILVILGFAAGVGAERYFSPGGSQATHAATHDADSEEIDLPLAVAAAQVNASTVEYHTMAPPPKEKIFLTDFDGGTLVKFNHESHTGVAECINCHHVEACSKCHLKNETQHMEVEEGKIALHKNCFTCHPSDEKDPETCAFCHYNNKS